MSSDLKQMIKSVAYEVARSYLDRGINMNDILFNMYSEGQIENPEILKRICESANNTVYLTLFKKPDQDRSNISFPLADAGLILEKSDEENDYMSVNEIPMDYMAMPIKIASQRTEREYSSEEMEKIAYVKNDNTFSKIAFERKLNQALVSVDNMISGMEMVKTASEKRFDHLIDKLASISARIVSNGESMGDMSKIAMTSVKSSFGGEGMVKVAKVCNFINEDLKQRGFKPSTEITKLSSLVIDLDSELSKVANELVLEIEKIAASKNIISGLKKTKRRYSKKSKCK